MEKDTVKSRDLTLERLISENTELSSLPQTLAHVIELSRDEYSSVDDLARVIENDVGLSPRVLRAANSPLVGSVAEISRISQATQTLGFRAVLSFALTASVYSMTTAINGRIDRVKFWRHSLETAVTSRILAEKLKGVDSDEAFTAGLLHDIGILVFDSSFGERYQTLIAKAAQGDLLIELEKSEWGATHAGAGAFLLRQWKIPESICAAVDSHHLLPEEVDSKSFSKLSLCVALANTIVRHRILEISTLDEANASVRVKLLAELGVTTSELELLNERLTTEFEAHANYLDIDIGTPAQLTSEANRALYRQYLVVEALLAKNNDLRTQICREQAEKQALRSLQAISGAYNHYLNNASATIQGHTQLIQMRLEKGEISESAGTLEKSLSVMQNSVEMISAVLKAIDELTHIETTTYHGGFEILDIEEMVAERKREIERMAQSLEFTVDKTSPTV